MNTRIARVFIPNSHNGDHYLSKRLYLTAQEVDNRQQKTFELLAKDNEFLRKNDLFVINDTTIKSEGR